MSSNKDLDMKTTSELLGAPCDFSILLQKCKLQ